MVAQRGSLFRARTAALMNGARHERRSESGAKEWRGYFIKSERENGPLVSGGGCEEAARTAIIIVSRLLLGPRSSEREASERAPRRAAPLEKQ